MVILIIEKGKLYTSRFCFQQFVIWQCIVSMHWKVALQVFTFALLKFVLGKLHLNCSVSKNASMKIEFWLLDSLNTFFIACFCLKISLNWRACLDFILLRIIDPLPPCSSWQWHSSPPIYMPMPSWWYCHIFPCSLPLSSLWCYYKFEKDQGPQVGSAIY